MSRPSHAQVASVRSMGTAPDAISVNTLQTINYKMPRSCSARPTTEACRLYMSPACSSFRHSCRPFLRSRRWILNFCFEARGHRGMVECSRGGVTQRSHRNSGFRKFLLTSDGALLQFRHPPDLKGRNQTVNGGD